MVEDADFDSSGATIPGQSPFEPIPFPAIVLQCFCTYVLILITWKVDSPEDAVSLLAGMHFFPQKHY